MHETTNITLVMCQMHTAEVMSKGAPQQPSKVADVSPLASVGVQAVLPDAVLLAVATARPESSSELISSTHHQLSGMNVGNGPEHEMPKGACARLQSHAEEVCQMLPSCTPASL